MNAFVFLAVFATSFAIGTFLLPTPGWVRKIAERGQDPAQIVRGFNAYFYAMGIFCFLPATAMSMLDDAAIPEILARFGASYALAMTGLGVLTLFQRKGAFAVIPVVGLSINAFLLERARKDVDDAEARVRLYEKFVLRAANADRGSAQA